MAVENYLGAMGQLADPNAAFQQGFANQQAIQGHAQKQQVQAFALQQAQAKAQQEQAQQQAYAQDVAAFIQKPTSDAAANLIVKYPQQHEALKQSFEVRDADRKEADRQGLAVVYSSLKSGRPELALKYLTDRQAADKAAGKPEPFVDALLSHLQNDPTGKAAQGLSALVLSQVDPEFAKTLGADGNTKGQVVGRAIGHYEGDKWITDYRDPDPGFTLSQGQTRFEGGAGSSMPTAIPDVASRIGAVEGVGKNPSSSASGVGQFTNKTWIQTYRQHAADAANLTPAQILQKRSDPAIATAMLQNLTQDNATALTQSGIAPSADNLYLAHFLGMGDAPKVLRADPSTPLSAVVSKASIDANPSILGGNRTVADLRNWASGKMAGGNSGVRAIATVAKADDVNNPQSDLRGEPYLATLPTSRQATIKAIAEGRTAAPKPGTKFGQALLEQVAQYDPSFDAANAQSRQKTRVDFTSGKSATAVNALNTAMGHLIHLDDQAHDLGNSSFAPGIINPIYNASRQAMGDTKLPAFQQTKQAAASEMRKVFAGSSGGNLTELQEWEKSLNESQSYPQLHAAIKNGVQLMGSRLDALKDQYSTGMQRSDQVPTFLKPSLARKAAQQFGVDLRQNVDTPVERQSPAAPPAGATKALRDPKTGKVAYLVGGKWVVK